MADHTRLQSFVERFVLPLVTGGPVHVEGIVPPSALKSFVADRNLDANLVARIAKAMHDRLARVGPVGAADILPIDAVALCAVWHNLLAMTHPEARGRGRLRRCVRAWCEAMLVWIDVPRTRAEVALRHALAGRIEVLGRVDTHVSFWAGYADFLGVPPPRALVAWPSLRRVEETRRRVDLIELLRSLEQVADADPDEDLLGIARAALAASPLTDLALADRPAFLGFAWGPPLLNALADESLRGAALRIVLRRGGAAVRAVEAATIVRARSVDTAPAVALALVRFHLELMVSDALSGRPAGGVAPTTVPQPLGLDVLQRLGHVRAAALVGLDAELLQRLVPPDPSRPLTRDPPSAPLLQRAGLLEVRS